MIAARNKLQTRSTRFSQTSKILTNTHMYVSYVVAIKSLRFGEWVFSSGCSRFPRESRPISFNIRSKYLFRTAICANEIKTAVLAVQCCRLNGIFRDGIRILLGFNQRWVRSLCTVGAIGPKYKCTYLIEKDVAFVDVLVCFLFVCSSVASHGNRCQYWRA